MPLSHSGDSVLGKKRAAPPRGRRLGPVDASEPIMFTIRVRPVIGTASLSPGNTQTSPLEDADHDQPHQGGDAPGVDPRDLETIQEFARETGLAIIDINSRQRTVVFWGTAGDIRKVLRIELAHYQYAGKIRREPIGRIYLPPAVAHVVEEITGLDAVLPDWVSSTIMSHGGQRIVAAQLIMSVLAFFVGGALITLGFFLYRANVSVRSTEKSGQTVVQRSTVAPPPVAAAPFPQEPVPAQSPAALGAPPRFADLEVAAWRSLDAGRLQEAQDDFLKILSLDPSRDSAMRGLVAVRRKMAGDNARLIRQQAAIYQDVLQRGGVGDEKYPPSSLTALVSAGLTAAQEIEAQSGPITASAPMPAQVGAPPVTHPAATPSQPISLQKPVSSRGEPRNTAVQPPKAPDHAAAPPARQGQKPLVAATPPPTPSAPSPTATAPQAHRPTTAPNPQPSSPASNALHMVRIGPVLDRDRAAALSKQLSIAGFPQIQVTGQTGYRVVSEPLPRRDAESLAATLAGQGFRTSTEPLTGDTVQLLFGIFTVQKEAETLSTRIAAAGYDAWIREATVYTLRLGPYPSASLTTITEIAKVGVPEATVASDPVP